jgi:hypothetical protein
MSFLFGKKNKQQQQQQQQSSALPPATRDISSSHGQPGPTIAATSGPNGLPGPREPEKGRGAPPSQTPTPGASVNNSFSSLQGPSNTASPEPKALRERADSENLVRSQVRFTATLPMLLHGPLLTVLCCAGLATYPQPARFAVPMVLETTELCSIR